MAIDEKAGRKIAQSLGIPIIGLVGIQLEAKEKSLIAELKPILDEPINKAGFYLGKSFYNKILQEVGEG